MSRLIPVTELIRDEAEQVQQVELQAVLSKRTWHLD